MERDTAALLVALVEQVGLLREDLHGHAEDWEKYEARVARIDRMIATLAASFVADAPALADAVVAALQTPDRTPTAASGGEPPAVILSGATLDKLLAAIEKVGLLRRDMQHRRELERYEKRFARLDQKLSALAEHLSAADPDAAKALRTAWQLPARSLAFRNAAHQKALKKNG